MKYFFLLLSLPLTLSLADYAPVLSVAGRQRVTENLATIEKNLKLAQGNIVNCKKNAVTIEAELKELSMLEQEHLQLKTKHKEQADGIALEIEKNNAAIRELETFQKNLANNKPSSSSENQANQQADLLKSQKDKFDREKWKEEAKNKSDKIKELIDTENKNLASIDLKKKQLREQLNQWLFKEREYQKLLADLTSKKIESEKILKTQN